MSPSIDIERLRSILLEEIIESYGLTAERIEWTPQQAALQIADFLPSLYGLVKAAEDCNNPHKFWDHQMLIYKKRELGFSSTPAFLEALNRLRESLKELPAGDREINT